MFRPEAGGVEGNKGAQTRSISTGREGSSVRHKGGRGQKVLSLKKGAAFRVLGIYGRTGRKGESGRARFEAQPPCR